MIWNGTFAARKIRAAKKIKKIKKTFEKPIDK